ncbi:MAG: CRISPR-associated protein [Cyanobacteria bacterium P01_C01_bin.70]
MHRNRFVEAISDPTKNFLAFFLVGTLLFTIVSDGVTDLFWKKLGSLIVARTLLNETAFQIVVTVGLIGGLLLLTYFTDIARWLRMRLSWFPLFAVKEIQGNVEPLKKQYRGLIVAMSPREQSPAEAAIRFHWNQGQSPHLEHCWIICTEKSLPFAKQLVSDLVEEGVTQKLELHYGTYELADADRPTESLSLLVPDTLIDDPNYIQRLVSSIYDDAIAQAHLTESEVIADYTGATKGMTAGILLACTRPERPLQYISQISHETMAVRVSYRLKALHKGQSPQRPRQNPAVSQSGPRQRD